MTATSLLLLVAPVVFLTIAARRDPRQPATVRLLAIVYGLPALVLLVYSLVWRLPATRILIELHGIGFRSDGGASIRKEVRERTPGSRSVLVGESTGRKRRAAAQTMFGTLVFEKGRLSIDLPAPATRSGIIGTATDGFLGALNLQNNDQLCIGETCWTYHHGTFTAAGQTFEIPPRRARLPGLGWPIPLPFAQPMPATVRTYSLDALSRRGPDAERIRSFVGYTHHSSSPTLVTLDGNVTLRRGGTVVAARSTYPIADGERISFYTLPAESPVFVAPPVVDRRSVVYRAGQRSFALDLDTPEIHSLTPDELNALRIDRDTKKVVALAMGDAQLVDRSLYFSGLSESVALQASSLLELSRFFPRDFQSSMRIISPRGPTQAVVGTTAWVGATDLASIRMLVLRPPLMLLLFALALQLLKVWAASDSRFTVAQALGAGALESLVGVRLLLGYRVWSMPPHKLEGAKLALVAWMMLPWVFLAASLPVARTLESVRHAGDRRMEKLRHVVQALPPRFFVTLTGLAFSMVFCAAVVEGPRKYVWLLCHLAAPVVPFLRAGWFTPRGNWLAVRASQSAVDRAAPEHVTARERTPNRELPTSHRLIWIAGIFCFARILLLLFGFKESATLAGGRISLSAIYIPAACILEGLFLAHVARLRRPYLRDALLIILLLWIIPSLLTSDIGLALLNVPVFVLLLLALDARKRVLRALVLAIIVFVAGAPLLRLALPLISNEETLLELASDSNYARFLHFAAPERLQELATKRGESLAITSAILQQYIRSGLFGRGYGHSEVTIHLGDTALRDFAPAVFVAAEWGLAGTMAMVVTYLLFAFLAWRLIQPPLRSVKPAVFIAAVAAGTIAVASIYMILANHELVLLTGKNAYLLGLDSAGDVIETFALLLLVAYGWNPGETS